MNVSLVASVVLIACSGIATHMKFDDVDYQIEPVGKKYFVIEPHVLLMAQDISVLQKNNCELLAEEIAKKERHYDICERAPESSMCRLLREDVVFKSKEENFQSPVVLFPVKRTWRLSRVRPLPNEAMLVRHVASTLGVRESDIIVKVGFPENMSMPTIAKHEGSLLKRVTKIVPLIPGHLEPPRIDVDVLAANNRFLACDLEKGTVNVGGQYAQTLSYVEDIAEEELEAIWLVYRDLKALMDSDNFKDLPNIVQAARIGRELALSIQRHHVGQDYSFERLFDDLFLLDDWAINLKVFNSKSDLKERQYPPQIFSKSIEVTWGLQ